MPLKIWPDGHVTDITQEEVKIPPMYGAKTRRGIPWTSEEVEYLRRWWYERGPEKIAFVLYRTGDDVESMARKLGLRSASEFMIDFEARNQKMLDELEGSL